MNKWDKLDLLNFYNKGLEPISKITENAIRLCKLLCSIQVARTRP